MKGQTFSRYTPWTPSSPKDSIEANPRRPVPLLIIGALLPIVLLRTGSVWQPKPRFDPPVYTSPPAGVFIQLAGAPNPLPGGRVYMLRSVKDSPFAPGTTKTQVLLSRGKPRGTDGTVKVFPRRLDQGPERVFTRFTFLPSAGPPHRWGRVWSSGWSKGIIDVSRAFPPILVKGAPPARPKGFVWTGAGTWRNDQEHQNKTFASKVVLDLGNRLRWQAGKVWQTGIWGRQDPPTGQERLNPVLVSLAGSKYPKGFILTIPRVKADFEERVLARGINSLRAWSSRPEGFVWQSKRILEETIHGFGPVVVRAKQFFHPGFVWQSAKPYQVAISPGTRESGKPLRLNTSNPHFPPRLGFVWQPKRVLFDPPVPEVKLSLSTVILARTSPGRGFVWQPALPLAVDRLNARVAILWQPRVPSRGFVWLSDPVTPSPVDDRSIRGVTRAFLLPNPAQYTVRKNWVPAGIRPGAAPATSSDNYWCVGDPVSGWQLQLMGAEDTCDVPWSVELTTGWEFGDPEQ